MAPGLGSPTFSHPPTGNKTPRPLLFCRFLPDVGMLQLRPDEGHRVAHGLRLETALERLEWVRKGWLDGAALRAHTAPPAHLGLPLSLSGHRLTGKVVLSNPDWEERRHPGSGTPGEGTRTYPRSLWRAPPRKGEEPKGAALSLRGGEPRGPDEQQGLLTCMSADWLVLQR